MVTVTKKQTSLALIAVVFATAMIVGTIASSSDNLAFAGGRSHHQNHGGHHGHHSQTVSSTSQSISQACDQSQNAPVTTTGAVSPPIASGINIGACVNANLGGNAAVSDQSS